ncbi:MAG: ribosome small subunit-dependent GTPase A [Salibacteraceae bacterium]
MKGRVTRSTGSWNTVRTAKGKLIPCKVKGNFRMRGIRSTNPIAVGDWVEFEDVDEESGVISKLYERDNFIMRKSINLSKRGQILASNIDQVLVFVTLKNPVTTKGFVDRVLVSAESYHITPVLVFNKADLLEEEDRENLSSWLNTYTEIGYQCIQTSVTESVNIEEVKEVMKDKTTMLAGHSGTGKSSLINAISPDLNLKVGAISDHHKQGKHTTTFAEMFPLDFGGEIIDTPGIRGFGVLDVPKSELSHYFVEMRELLPECKFNNCQHLKEPGCAIKQAVVDGEIVESRFKSYLSMYDEDENETFRTVNY